MVEKIKKLDFNTLTDEEVNQRVRDSFLTALSIVKTCGMDARRILKRPRSEKERYLEELRKCVI